VNPYLVACLSAFLALAAEPAPAQTGSETFKRLVADEWAWRLREFPEFATYTGAPGANDRWTDMTRAAIDSRKAHARELLDRVRGIDRARLDAADRMDLDLFRKDAEEVVEGQRFPVELMPVNQLTGVQQELAQTIVNAPARDVKDYEDLVARIASSGARIDQETALLRWGLEMKLTPPAMAIRDVPEQVQSQIVGDPMRSPLLTPFARMPATIPAADRERLVAAASRAYTEQARPAFQRMHTFLVNDYLPKARETIALIALPDGEAWYAFNVRTTTTTGLTPKQIHEIGLAEVKRIRAEMDAVIVESGFTGNFVEFCDMLRTDPGFYFTDKESLLAAYRDVAKRIDPELPKLFGKLPRLPYGVLPVPEYAEKSQTTAYYMPGSPKAGRPGNFFANTYKLETRPKWEMESLTAHEAVPGHHLQIALAQELENTPEFRRWSGPTAFVEGWGLYAESLGGEIGLYKDPYSKFGRLTYEIWRAIRLVVDTGMHSMGWTRQQAIDYFMENTGRQLHDITVEVDRYIVWPGQALAYKIGELKFKELRARAQAALGDTFDVRTFHDACLENGAIPLDVLERHIDEWIAQQKNSGRAAASR
jgi:uncharacterized protein (DUF885 family)